MTTFSPKRPVIVELDAVARVLMDDVAIDQHVPNLDNALVEGDPVRLSTADDTGAEDLIVDDPDLLDRPGVAEVDVRGLQRCRPAQVSAREVVIVITLHVDIKGVAVNDDVAVQAAAADRPNGISRRPSRSHRSGRKVLFKMRIVSIAVVLGGL
jgi:hypothetical protein